MSNFTEYFVDPVFWYNNRQVEFTPKHFIFAKTQLSYESLLWVINKLKGRYSIETTLDNSNKDILSIIPSTYASFGTIAFEDPKEAVLFELTWS